MLEMRELTLWSVFLRILVAAILGGMMGFERGMKNRPAGLRTYMLVCIGACTVMMTNQYVFQCFATGDIVRMGAQVVSGIGFLGAGTIIITSHNRIKGLTTAAGLWASACVGLAIGIGFYEVALIGAAVIVLILTLLHIWDNYMRRYSRSMEVYIELESSTTVGELLKCAKKAEISISNISLRMDLSAGNGVRSLLATAKLKKPEDREFLLRSLQELPGVYTCEEID